ncbi:protein CpxP [Pedobacter sp. UYP30]|uniref:hypothetical protein n=1 Tax=Pedobacter sp. UYP30 TaxID=1756400 RepID=UPI00339AA068
MKKLMLTAALTIMGLGAVFAQTTTNTKLQKKAKYTAEQRAQKATDKLDKKVMLTADQKTKVYQLELSKFNKSKDLTAQNLDKEAKKSQFKKMDKASNKELYGVLTSDQQTKLKEMKTERKDKMAGKHKKGNKDHSAPMVSNPPAQVQ